MPAWLLSLMVLVSQAGQYATVRAAIDFIRSPFFSSLFAFFLVLVGIAFGSIPLIIVGFGLLIWLNRKRDDDHPPVSPA